jgi:uncharacterized membrane protein YoaK (UPF0700 family)
MHPPASSGDTSARAERIATWQAYAAAFVVGAAISGLSIVLDFPLVAHWLALALAVIVVVVAALPRIDKIRYEARQKGAKGYSRLDRLE